MISTDYVACEQTNSELSANAGFHVRGTMASGPVARCNLHSAASMSWHWRALSSFWICLARRPSTTKPTAWSSIVTTSWTRRTLPVAERGRVPGSRQHFLRPEHAMRSNTDNTDKRRDAPAVHGDAGSCERSSDRQRRRAVRDGSSAFAQAPNKVHVLWNARQVYKKCCTPLRTSPAPAFENPLSPKVSMYKHKTMSKSRNTSPRCAPPFVPRPRNASRQCDTWPRRASPAAKSNSQECCVSLGEWRPSQPPQCRASPWVPCR